MSESHPMNHNTSNNSLSSVMKNLLKKTNSSSSSSSSSNIFKSNSNNNNSTTLSTKQSNNSSSNHRSNISTHSSNSSTANLNNKIQNQNHLTPDSIPLNNRSISNSSSYDDSSNDLHSNNPNNRPLKRFFKHSLLNHYSKEPKEKSLHNFLCTGLNNLKIDESKKKKSKLHHPLHFLFKPLKPKYATPSTNSNLNNSSSSSSSGIKQLNNLVTAYQPNGSSSSNSSTTNSSSSHHHTVSSNSSSSGNSSLAEKYGVPGKILGEGAGGSVAIIERSTDKHLFAVKQFKAKKSNESEFDYNKKVKNEYYMGLNFHHQNIIETYDLIQENSTFIVVMEFCPYDFFTIVMGGIMSKHEILCYFKQLISGVRYLHSIGIAHRDLKLDNCVVNSDGILKLIDFGSAVQFKYEGDDENIIKATGIVGSDPYLAPEVFDLENYNPPAVDVWSVAIIFCCMILRKFPWKAPKYNDPSFKSFLNEPKEFNDDPVTSTTVDSDQTAKDSSSTTTSPPSTTTSSSSNKLFKLLPRVSRPLISKMLEIKPVNRFTIDEVYNDDWIKSINQCHYDDTNNDELVKNDDHNHHLITEDDLEKIQQEKKRQRKLSKEESKQKISA